MINEVTEEINLSELTIKKLDEMCETFKSLKDKKSVLEDQISEVETERKTLELKIIEFLKETGKPNWVGDFGTISVRVNKQVKQPQTMEDKLKFFDYLQAQGIFESMVSVNAKTLTSWAAKEIETKEQQGEYGWVPPGLETPTEYFSLALRKK